MVSTENKEAANPRHIPKYITCRQRCLSIRQLDSDNGRVERGSPRCRSGMVWRGKDGSVKPGRRGNVSPAAKTFSTFSYFFATRTFICSLRLHRFRNIEKEANCVV